MAVIRNPQHSHVFAVASALAAFGQSAREAVGLATKFGDVDTADLFTEISRGIDKQLWFVESHTAPKSPKANVVGLKQKGNAAVPNS